MRPTSNEGAGPELPEHMDAKLRSVRRARVVYHIKSVYLTQEHQIPQLSPQIQEINSEETSSIVKVL